MSLLCLLLMLNVDPRIHVSAFSSSSLLLQKVPSSFKNKKNYSKMSAKKLFAISSIFTDFSWNLSNSNKRNEEEAQKLLQALLDRCNQLGQVGSKCTEEERTEITIMARKLIPYSLPSPATYPVTGIHRLVHTHSKGGSSGAIGPFLVGQVTQEFLNKEQFINAVHWGPLKISLFARRKTIDKNRVQVYFDETVIQFLGKDLKRVPAKGSGVWKCLFVGEFYDDRIKKNKLIRIIEAPSLFVLEQIL